MCRWLQMALQTPLHMDHPLAAQEHLSLILSTNQGLWLLLTPRSKMLFSVQVEHINPFSNTLTRCMIN